MTKKRITEKNKVLYFDDDPFINSALAKTLNLFDWDVKLVPDIDTLFKEMKTQQFDVLMLDQMAPIPKKKNQYVNFSSKEIDEMDMGINVGVVVAKRIWKDFNKNIPILFLSAKMNPLLDNPELNDYTCDYLRKPQLARDVDEKLRELLSRKKD